MTHKISLHAGGVLLDLYNIHSSLSETLLFIAVSDYSVNWNKSTTLSVNCNI